MAVMVTEAKAHAAKTVAAISEAELAVRMCEANYRHSTAARIDRGAGA